MSEVIPEFEFRNVTKYFGTLVANDDVSFAVSSGTVHGVVGENGAGKSTIMKVLYGLYQPEAGEIWIRGRKEIISSPQKAIHLGIGMVHQHFMLVPTFEVWQNVILGSEPSVRLQPKEVITELDRLQKEFGFNLDLHAITEDLPVGQQQQVEILKLLYRKASILILDEPTAVLTPLEVDSLFERLNQLRQSGKTIVLISHKLREILSFTQCLTVMRSGKVITTLPTGGLTDHDLAELIVGRKVFPLPARKPCTSEKRVLRAEGVSVARNGKTLLKDLSFEVKGGEILGFAGVSGNGQSELIEILAAVNRKYSGRLLLDDEEMSHFPSAYSLKQGKLGIIPSDRHREGVILPFSISENFMLGHHREARFCDGFRVSRKKTQAKVQSLMEQFDVRPRAPETPIGALSGGNQQKVIVARETSEPVRLIVAAYPTRGVDIGAIEFIHSHFLRLRDQGAAIVLLSSELEEILALSDRIVVLYEGSIVGEVPRAEATEKQLGLWMTGGGTH